jgi:hypothetical protein
MKILVSASEKDIKSPIVNGIREYYYPGEKDPDNRYYCELTAFYYMVKHEKNQYLGLEQYKRTFRLKTEETGEILIKNDVICHNTLSNAYYDHRTIYERLVQGFGCGSLAKETDRMIFTIKYQYPEYYSEMKDILNSRSHWQHNMIISSRDICNAYADWLFPMLDIFIKKFDINTMPKRAIGHLAELLLLTLWLDHQKIKIFDSSVFTLDKYNDFRANL